MDDRARLLDPKERITSLLQQEQPLSKDDLNIIEGSFSKSNIKRLINSYPHAYQRFLSDARTFSGSWPDKIRAVLEDVAIERFKKDPTFEAQIPDGLLFGIVLPWTWSFNWFSKRSFCSPQNRVVRLALDRIKRDLIIPGETRAKALARLENFPTELINEVVTTDNFNLEKTEINYLKINAVWAEHKTPEFQALLNAKKVDEFTQRLNGVEDVETLEKLMRQLIFRIKNSFFKSKYEAMLEACFIRVMELTPPQEAMKLDTLVVKEGLDVFQNYIFSSNRRNFFHKTVREGYAALSYFRRRVPRFDKVPKFQMLLQPYTIDDVSQFEEDKLVQEIKLGNVDIQGILQDAAFCKDSTYHNLVRRLLNHGASLEWMDANYTFYHEQFSQLSFFTIAVWNHYKKAHWEFYVAQKNGDYNAILKVLIDTYVHLRISPNLSLRGVSGMYEKCAAVISDILKENPNVRVTQEMLDKMDSTDPFIWRCVTNDPQQIKEMLRKRFAAQQTTATTAVKKDKGERGADVNNNNNDESLERLKYVLENEHYFVDINPLVQALGERINELDEVHWEQLYLHELTPETRRMLREDENVAVNRQMGKMVRSGYLTRLRGEEECEYVNLLIRKAGSAVKTLTSDEVQRLRSFKLDKDVQIFLSKYFNADLVETVTAHESSTPVHGAGAAAGVDPQVLAQEQPVAPGF